jgi:uncharacterized lipoprotein YajG
LRNIPCGSGEINKKRIVNLMAVSAALMLAGCAAAPKTLWVRVDGQRVRDNPVLMQRGEVDRTICLGERQRATLSGVTVAPGGLYGAIAAQERGHAGYQVAAGCMAEKGYLLVTEDQAEAKSAELAAIAEQKKKQEAAAAVPPAKRASR